MKNSLLLVFIVLLSQKASAKIWLVDNSSSYLINNVQTAISDSASSGDTIMVMGGLTLGYGSIAIDKSIVLIGEGINNQYGNNTKFDLVSIRSSNVQISGIRANFRFDTWGFTDTISNVTIERCFIGNAYAFNFNGRPNSTFHGTYKNILIRNNIFDGGGYFSFNDVDGAFTGCRVKYDSLYIENNIFSNYTFVRYFPDQNVLGFETVTIKNNVFINGPTSPIFDGPGQFMDPIFNVKVVNNIFHTINHTGCNSCDFINNLTFNSFVNDTLFSVGLVTGNIYGQDPLFTNYMSGNFDPGFGNDFNLLSNSPATGAGLNGDTIGITGGNYPFILPGVGPRVPDVTDVTLTNVAVPQTENFFLNLKAQARRLLNDNEFISEIKYSFDTILPFGQGFTLPITPGLDLAYIDSIPPVNLDSGLHSITFIGKDSKGAYGFPRTVSFNVCTFNETVADLDYYLSGRDVILNANYKNATSTLWDFGDGQTSNQQQNPLVHHFDTAAIYTIILNNNNPCFSTSSSKSIFIKGINSVSPTKGGNIGIVTMTITGAGFNDSANVKLVKLGQQDLIPIDSSTTITNGTVIQTSFNLSGATLGLWDVVVENPDTTFILIGGLEIDSMLPIITATQIIGSNFMRLNTWHDYTILVENKSNVDVVAVPTWFAVPEYMSVQINFEYTVPNDTSLLWDTVPLFFVADTIFDKFYNYKVYGFILPRIAASGISDIIRIKLKRTTGPNLPLKIIAWSKEPLFYDNPLQMLIESTSPACNSNPKFVNCSICLAGSFMPGTPLGCLGSTLSGLYSLYCDGWEIKKPAAFTLGIISTSISCGVAVATIPASFPATALGLAGAASGAAGCKLDACSPPLFPPNDNDLFPIQAVDPNEKYGNNGALNSPYLNSQSPINYSIHFENVDTATASAQKVILIDTLDKFKLDLSTFQLSSFGFADTIIAIPAGRKSFTTNVDLQPILPLVVQFASYLNDSTGVLTSTFTSLDPLTMEPTNSVLLGFLLPNDSTGRGEGFVSFAIRTITSIQTGDTINNKAYIYFDENDPIITPQWTNIIDNFKPQGQVISAAQISNTDSISVSWSSVDNGPAGVYTHNVYYNVNGGDWILWKYNTSLTSDIFVGVMDSTYGFYSVAIDSAYNVEDAPLTPDVTTTLMVGLEEMLQAKMIVKLFPNPANNTLNVFINRLDKSKNDFNIIGRDVTGRLVSNDKIHITAESGSIQIDISQFVSGIYHFEITDGTNRIFKKLIKNE